MIDVFRGQIYGDFSDAPSGLSWTLSEDIADWYAKPLPGQIEQGHVLQLLVPKSAILAIFEDELEVILDLNLIKGLEIKSRQGRTNEVIETLWLNEHRF